MSNTFTRDPQPRIQYSGDGSRTTFGFPFPVLASDDLLVFVNDMPATGFAIDGLTDPAGGEITFVDAAGCGNHRHAAAADRGHPRDRVRRRWPVPGGCDQRRARSDHAPRPGGPRGARSRACAVARPKAQLDFCLPPSAERANRLLGFDSAGRPMVFGQAELPSSGDASGLLVTPSGGTTARALGEHLAALVNVRDFGAIGDGVTDDAAAFQAAIATAQTRSSPVYVPASPTAYLLGATLTLDGVALVGEGAGSTLKLALSSGAALQLMGSRSKAERAATARPRRERRAERPGRCRSQRRQPGRNRRSSAAPKGAILHGVEVIGCRAAW